MNTPLLLALLTVIYPSLPNVQKPDSRPPAPPADQLQAPSMAPRADLHRQVWTPRLEDRQWLEGLVAADLAAMADARCVNPLLRGQALPGDPADLYLDLAEAWDSPHAACHDLAAGLNARDFDDPKAEHLRILDQLAGACADTVRALQETTRFPTACSPFQVGLPDGGQMPRLGMLIGAVGLVQRRQVIQGQYQDALDLALDLAAFSQNVGRGWATLHQGVMGANQWLSSSFPVLKTMLDMRVLTRSQLMQLIIESGVLLASEQPLGKMVVADQTDLVVKAILPPFFGENWSPPAPPRTSARKPSGVPPPPSLPPPRSQFQLPSQVMFFYLAMRLKGQTLLASCGPKATFQDCARQMARQEALEKVLAAETGQWTRFRKALQVFGPARGLAMFLVLADNPPNGPALSTLLYRFLARRMALSYLRLHAAIQLHELEFGGAPSPAALASPAWQQLLLDHAFGGRLQVTFDGKTAQVASAPLPEDMSGDQKRDFSFSLETLGVRVDGITPIPQGPKEATR